MTITISLKRSNGNILTSGKCSYVCVLVYCYRESGPPSLCLVSPKRLVLQGIVFIKVAWLVLVQGFEDEQTALLKYGADQSSHEVSCGNPNENWSQACKARLAHNDTPYRELELELYRIHAVHCLLSIDYIALRTYRETRLTQPQRLYTRSR